MALKNGRSAKTKGSAFERDVADLFTKGTGYPFKRVLLSGIRGEGDVDGLNWLHIECKRQENMNLVKCVLDEKPKADAKQALFALIHKKNRLPIMATLPLDDLILLVRHAMDSGLTFKGVQKLRQEMTSA